MNAKYYSANIVSCIIELKKKTVILIISQQTLSIIMCLKVPDTRKYVKEGLLPWLTATKT